MESVFFSFAETIQGIPDSEAKTVLDDLEQVMPQEVRRWIDWEQTGSGQGPSPRTILVSLWFKHDTGLMLMIEILKMVRNELNKSQFGVNGERVRTNLEIGPQKKPFGSPCDVLHKPQGRFRR